MQIRLIMELTTTNQEIEKLNPEQLTKHVLSLAYPINVAQALNSKTDKLSTIKREYGKEFTIALICLFVGEVAGLCKKHADRILSTKDTLILANDVFDNYYYMSTQEIRYAFIQGYKEQYDKKIFDTLELSHFTAWLEAYDKERVNYIHNNPERKPEPLQLSEPQEPETVSEYKFSQELIRKRQLLELEQQRERDMEFLSIADYCEYFNIDFKKLFAETNPHVDIAFYASEKLRKTFLDVNGIPDSNRFKQHVAKVTLHAYNKYKPKTYDDCVRIAFDIINKH